MTIFDPAHGRVINGGGAGNFLRLIGLGIAAFLLVILFFSSGHPCRHRPRRRSHPLRQRQTGGTLGEGIHLINPLKTNNELSIQTQTSKNPPASLPAKA